MTEKDKTLKEDQQHDCECEDCDCGTEANTITLDMEDGTTKDFTVLGLIEFEGNEYVALAEVGSTEYDILSFVENDDEETIELNVIEDDELFDRVADAFDEYFSSDEDMEEM